jgi:hypothetical protein
MDGHAVNESRHRHAHTPRRRPSVSVGVPGNAAGHELNFRGEAGDSKFRFNANRISAEYLSAEPSRSTLQLATMAGGPSRGRQP